MHINRFFTKQRWIILAIGAVSFVGCILLAHHYSHESESGLLFIDLAGSAVTIIATALAIEYLQYREKADKTHQVAAIAEEEIQVICYRVKLAIVQAYGFREDADQQAKLHSLDDIGAYIKQTGKQIDAYYQVSQAAHSRPAHSKDLAKLTADCASLQREIEKVISLFDYALPFTLRATVLALRSSLQISERTIGYMHEAGKLSTGHRQLLRELTDAVFAAAQNVLQHESRTAKDKPLSQKPARSASHR